MYRIIGGDQKEYGPVTAEQLRQWITEGRLSGQSLVQAEGDGEWKPLSTFPEFADALRPQAGQASLAGQASRPQAAVWRALKSWRGGRRCKSDDALGSPGAF